MNKNHIITSIIMLCSVTAAQALDNGTADFFRRYGPNSAIFNEPVYFNKRNEKKEVPARITQHKKTKRHHNKKVVKSTTASHANTTTTTVTTSKRLSSKAKRAVSHAKQTKELALNELQTTIDCKADIHAPSPRRRALSKNKINKRRVNNA